MKKAIILAATAMILTSTPVESAVSTRGLDHRLQNVLRKIKTRCAGFRMVSGVRKTYIRSRKRKLRSLHWSGKAADFRVRNYSCAYKVLASWQYGMSNDARRCKHIHISVPGSHRERKGFRHRWC